MLVAADPPSSVKHERAELAKHGLEPAPGTREDLARFVAAENEKWGKVVREAKITAE